VVTSAIALLQRTFTPRELQRRLRRLERGETLDPLDLIEWLEIQGYEPEAQVTQKGELALRGGILDVFPLNTPWPVRFEFFGNELESLRFFDPATQLSREPINETVIAPAGELGLLERLTDKKPSPSPDYPQPTFQCPALLAPCWTTYPRAPSCCRRAGCLRGSHRGLCRRASSR
jgi:transcription-repair coupling factor (superfamily II helicase)